MSGRSWFPVGMFTSQGLVFCAFSFLTNNTSDPDPADFRGFGGETGGAASNDGTVSNSGPSCVASVKRTGTGVHSVALADGYRFVQAAHVDMDDDTDSLITRIGNVASEGDGNDIPVTFDLVTRDPESTHAATDTTGRRISVLLILKNSGSGT